MLLWADTERLMPSNVSECVKLLTTGTPGGVFERARCAKFFFPSVNANGPLNNENVENQATLFPKPRLIVFILIEY